MADNELIFPDITDSSSDEEICEEDIIGNIAELKKISEEILDSEELEYPDVYYLPILFSIDKNKKERMWKIYVSDDTVHRIQGLTQGKKIPYSRVFKGKNIGKKNETSPHEQAKQAAETMWVKQIDKNYFPKCKEGKALLAKIRKSTSSTGGHNINAGAAIRGRNTKNIKRKASLAVKTVQTKITPMKAGVWELSDSEDPHSVLPKVIKYFNFDEGVYVQPKFDGWRAVARVQFSGGEHVGGEREVVFTTNNSKQYPWFEHLRKEVLELISTPAIAKLALDGLDGEFYAHRIVDEKGEGLSDEARFSTISSMCGVARSEPHPLETQMQFHVFDLVDLSGKLTQDQRFANLKKIFRGVKSSPNIILSPTKIARNIKDITRYHNLFAQEGYEGIIIRSRDLIYIQKRSMYIRKYKHFIDREYPIIDVRKDEGVDDEHFVWVCHDPSVIDPKTQRPKRFKAKPRGCREDKVYWYENYLEYIGMPLTVRFQEYSDDGVPRFPIGIGIREDQ